MSLLWLAVGLQSVVAQETYEEVKTTYIELRFDEGGFETMKRNTEEKGISPSELGSWMERSGNVMIKIEWIGGESRPHLFMVYTVDSRGNIRGKESLKVQLSERPTTLGQLTGGMLPRITGELLAFDVFMPMDMFIPQMDYADSPQTAERLMSEVTQRAIRSSGSEMAVVVMVVPDEQEYSSKVSPGIAVFTGSGK